MEVLNRVVIDIGEELLVIFSPPTTTEAQVILNMSIVLRTLKLIPGSYVIC